MTVVAVLNLLKSCAVLALIVGVIFIIRQNVLLKNQVQNINADLAQKQRKIQDLQSQITMNLNLMQDLQKRQQDLQQQHQQRVIHFNEAINHDQPSQTWAHQSVPNSLAGMLQRDAATGADAYFAQRNALHPQSSPY